MSDLFLRSGSQTDDGAAGQSATDTSLRALYSRHWLELCTYIAKTFGPGPPEPEDVVQTAFEKYAKLEHPEDVQNPRAFLYRVARNTVLDHKRRQKTRFQHAQLTKSDASHIDVDEISPERVLISKERLEIIESAIKDMSEKHRHVFLLSALEGCRYAEISRRTGIPRSSVRRYVLEALTLCDEALEAAAVSTSNSLGE